MSKRLIGGLSSVLLPMGLYGMPTYAAGAYQRSYLSAAINRTALDPLGTPMRLDLSDDVGTQSPRELPLAQAAELDIISAIPVHELVVIDAAVPDKHVFYRNIKPGVDIVEISSDAAGLLQLTEVLKKYTNLTALHIVSHAEDGALLLGNSRITAENIKHEIAAFAALNGALREGGDLLLYGCDLAKSEAGTELLDIVQQNTHLDLAASSNLTGDDSKAGDWNLEIRRGEIESSLPFSGKAIADFSNVLAGTFTLQDFGYTTEGKYANTGCPTDRADYTWNYDSLSQADYIGCGFMHNNGYVGATTIGLRNDFGGDSPAFLEILSGFAMEGQATVSGTNHIEIRNDTSAFQLTNVVADEFSGSTTIFSDVWITGYVEGGGEITSEHITTDGSSVSTFTFDSANALSNFVGVNLTKFRLSFINQTGSSVDYMRLVSFTTQPAVTNNAPTDISLDAASISQNATGAGAVIGNLETTDADGGDTHTYSLVANGASDNGSCGAAGDDNNASFQVDNVNDDLETAGSLSAGTYNICVETDDGTASYQESFTISVTVDADGTLTAGPAAEAIGLDTSIDTVGEAVDIFDFTMADGSGGDGVSMMVSQIVVNVSGTSTDAERGQVTWRLEGPDVSNVTGTYNAGSDTITFSGLSISIADGDNETYTVNAFFNDNTNVVEDHTFILNVNGDDDLTVGAGGTQMSGGNADITNGAGASIDVTATRLAFTTQPAGSVSGSALTSQPAVVARDEFGNIDVDFTETITLSEASAGSLSGDVDVAAVAGVASFTDVAYNATTDQQSFTLTANDQDGVGTDLPTVDANAVTSDVVATKLVFSTQPAPTNVISGQATSLTTVPVVSAMDANDVVDTGYSPPITLAEVNGAGTATLTGTGDTDGDGATVALNPASGVATYVGMQLTYTAAGSANETFNLRASSGGLTTADSASFTATVSPLVSSVDVPVNGAYKTGDTLTFTVNTSESVTVSGTPRIAVTVGSDTVYADYSSGASAPTALAFTYTVTAGDLDSNGIAIAGVIDANGGTLQDGDANDLILTLNSVASTAAVLVDAVAPTISSVSVPAADTYLVGETLSFTVNTTENVTVTGTPSLPVTIGATAREANYASGSGTSALVFSYTVQAGDTDSDGIAIGASAALNGGTLRDAAGNDLTLELNSVGATTGVLVDATAPDAPTAPDLDAGSDTGRSSTDNITNDTTPTLTGTAEANSTVAIVSSENGALGTTTADGSGTWSFTPGSALVAGEHDFTATATDAAGNTSPASAALAVTIDTTAPASNGVEFDQTDINGTNLTAVSFKFVGAEIDSLANYTITSTGGGVDLTGSASVTDPEGQVSGLNVSGLNDGDLTLSVTLTDIAGNVSDTMTDVIIKDTDPVLILPLDPDAIVDGATTTITGVSVTGTDSTSITVELSVAAGTISIADSDATIVGNNTAEVSLTGTLVQVNDALAGLSFTAAVNTADDQTLQINVEDGIGSTSGTLNIVIHDRPDIDNLGGTVTFTIGGNAVLLDSSPLAVVSDLDNANFNGGTLTIGITAGAAPLQDLLSFNTDGDISLAGLTHGSNVFVDGTPVGTLVNDITEGEELAVALNSNATPGYVALLLQALTYDNPHGSPTTGTRTVTITLDDGLAERVITLSVSVQNPPPTGGGGNVIDNNQSNNNLTGTVTITEDGVLNGGTVTGTINSSGIIAGNVTLGASTVINGGTITGNITGDAAQPARINSAMITATATLSNVVIGEDTVLQPGVKLGGNVKFESEASIPPGLDLTGALRTLDWSTGDARSVAILDDDVLSPNAGEDPMTIIRAIQLLDDYEPTGNSVTQSSSNGEILVVTSDFQAAVLPVQVTMAGPNDVEGTYINDDGDIVFVTVNRRVVLSYPVVASLPSFMALLEGAGLELTYNARANMQVRSRSDNVAGVLGREVLAVTSEGGDFYYSARPDVLALPAHRGNTPGLMEFPIPGLGSPNGLSIIFADENGTLHEQDLIPASPDWPGLKAGLLAIEGLTHVSIDIQGIVSVTLNGQTVRGRLEYVVFTGREAARDDVIIRAVGDKTGNGQQDYEVVYQNGDVQYLYVF